MQTLTVLMLLALVAWPETHLVYPATVPAKECTPDIGIEFGWEPFVRASFRCGGAAEDGTHTVHVLLRLDSLPVLLPFLDR